MDIDKLSLDIAKNIIGFNIKNVDIYDVHNKCKIAKRFVVCVVDNCMLSKKIATSVKELCKPIVPCLHTDGIIKGDWIVIDYKDVIVHIFTKNTYQKYNFDKLWKDNKNYISVDLQYLNALKN